MLIALILNSARGEILHQALTELSETIDLVILSPIVAQDVGRAFTSQGSRRFIHKMENMSGLETALAATGFKVLGEELVDWIKNRGDSLSETDWAEMGLVIRRKLEVDYENIESSFLHKSRKPTVVHRIESAAEIYRELELLGREREFDQATIEIYSDLADICSNWAVETEGFGTQQYKEWAMEYFEQEEEYRRSVE